MKGKILILEDDIVLSEQIANVVKHYNYEVMQTINSDQFFEVLRQFQPDVLLKYYQLADDIAFRFSNRDWPEYPLTVDKFVHWIDQLTLAEKGGKNLFLNLFMDYETFGEHQWASTGIFDFMRHFPDTGSIVTGKQIGRAHV